MAGGLLSLYVAFDEDGTMGWRRTSPLVPLALVGAALGYYFHLKAFGAFFGIGFGSAVVEAVIKGATEQPKAVSAITAKRVAVDDPARRLLEGLFASWHSDEKKQKPETKQL